MLSSYTVNIAYDRSKTIADMFEELVQTIPDHTAVVFKDKKYTENIINNKLLSDKLDVNLGYVH